MIARLRARLARADYEYTVMGCALLTLGAGAADQRRRGRAGLGGAVSGVDRTLVINLHTHALRLAGFAEQYASDSAMAAGGKRLVAKVRACAAACLPAPADEPVRDFKPTSVDAAIDRCPICSHAAALFQYATGPDDDRRTFVVSCDSPAPEGLGDFECPMNPPPWRFHGETKKQAVTLWNDFARMVKAARKQNASVRATGASS